MLKVIKNIARDSLVITWRGRGDAVANRVAAADRGTGESTRIRDESRFG